MHDLDKPAEADDSTAPAVEVTQAATLPVAGTPPCDVGKLNKSQRLALAALAAGRSLSDAAAEANVDRTTLYRWRKNDAAFIAALNAWRTQAANAARDRLLALADEATRTLGRALQKDDARTALAILKGIGSLTPAPKAPETADEVVVADNLANRRRQLQADKRLLKLRREEAKTYLLGVPEKLKEEEEGGYR